MVAQYAPRIAGRPAAAIEEHDGMAILMAQALGADLAHMDATEVAFLGDPQLMARGILVNGRGQRYVAEDTYPGRIGQLTLYHQDDTAFLVIDADAHEQAMATRTATPFLLRPPTWVCETVAELEAEMGLPTGSLQTTVAAYNTAPPAARTRCCTRRRSGCARSARRSAPSTCAATPAASPSAGCTRRWTAGCCTSAANRSPACSRPGGPPRPLRLGLRQRHSLGDGSFYGRRAGRAAATLTRSIAARTPCGSSAARRAARNACVPHL